MQTAPSQASVNRQQGCFAVKVRARAEATITNSLRNKGYEVLLPTHTQRRQYTDRVHVANCALFPGYVFVRLNPQELLRVLSTEGVSYVVKSGKTLQPLPREEESLIESLIAVEQDCEPCAVPQVGQRVQIRSGPFKDQRGTLVRVGGREQLVLTLDSIFSSVTVPLKDIEVMRCDA